MCLPEQRPATLAGARTDAEYVLALDAPTRRRAVVWQRAEGGTWLGEVQAGDYLEHHVRVRRSQAGSGVLEAFDRRGRVLRTVVAATGDARLLLVLTGLLVAVARPA